MRGRVPPRGRQAAPLTLAASQARQPSAERQSSVCGSIVERQPVGCRTVIADALVLAWPFLDRVNLFPDVRPLVCGIPQLGRDSVAGPVTAARSAESSIGAIVKPVG